MANLKDTYTLDTSPARKDIQKTDDLAKKFGKDFAGATIHAYESTNKLNRKITQIQHLLAKPMPLHIKDKFTPMLARFENELSVAKGQLTKFKDASYLTSLYHPKMLIDARPDYRLSGTAKTIPFYGSNKALVPTEAVKALPKEPHTMARVRALEKEGSELRKTIILTTKYRNNTVRTSGAVIKSVDRTHQAYRTANEDLIHLSRWYESHPITKISNHPIRELQKLIKDERNIFVQLNEWYSQHPPLAPIQKPVSELMGSNFNQSPLLQMNDWYKHNANVESVVTANAKPITNLVDTDRKLKKMWLDLRKVTHGYYSLSRAYETHPLRVISEKPITDLLHSERRLKSSTERIKDYFIHAFNRIKSKFSSVSNAVARDMHKLDRISKRTTGDMSRGAKRVGRNWRESGDLLGQWWKRFGQVGLGFTLVYRAMNAVEEGIRAFIGSIGRAISLSGEFVAIQARMAMAGSMFGSNAKNFNEAFKLAGANVEAFKRAAVGSISTVEDLAQGLSELARYDYFPNPKQMKNAVNFMDFINQIATTTGSAGRQIKQEIQSLFQGAKRVGNVTINLLTRLEKSGSIAEKNIIERIKAGGVAGKQALDFIIKFFGEYEGKVKAILAEKSPTYAWTVNLGHYLIQLQDIIARSVPVAERLGLFMQKAKLHSNIFAVAINKDFKLIEDALNSKRFQTAIAINMTEFLKFTKTLTRFIIYLGHIITYTGAAIATMPTWVKKLVKFWSVLAMIAAASWALKSNFKLLWAVLRIGFKPLSMLIGQFTVLAGMTIKGRLLRGLVHIRRALAAMAGAATLANAEFVALIASMAALIYLEDKYHNKIDNFFKSGEIADVKRHIEMLKKSGREVLDPNEFEYFRSKGERNPSVKERISYWESMLTVLKNDKSKTNSILTNAKDFGKKIGKSFVGIYDSMTKGFALSNNKAYQNYLKAAGKTGKELSAANEKFVKGLQIDFKQAYDKAIKSGDLSLAERYVPYVKAQTQLEINVLRAEYNKVSKEYNKLSGDLKIRAHLRMIQDQMQIKELEKYKATVNPTKEIFGAIQERIYKKAIQKETSVRKKAMAEYYRDIKKNDLKSFTETENTKLALFKRFGIGPKILEVIRNHDLQKYLDGVKNKFKNTFDAIATFNKDTAQAMMQGMQTFFFDAMTGKLNSLKSVFKSFSDAIMQSVAKIATQEIMLKIGLGKLSGTGSAGSTTGITDFLGSAFSFVSKILPFASGGDFYTNGPMPILVGEAGREHVKITPINKEKQTGQNTQVHITNVVDPALFGDYLASPQGEGMILNVIARNNYKVRKTLGG